MAKGNGHGFYLDPTGMLQCCVDYLNELHDNHSVPTEIGVEIVCEYCKGDLRLNDEGVWVWITSKTKSQDAPNSS
jgi:hypothetical protein